MTDFPSGLHGAYRRADLIKAIGWPRVRKALHEGGLVVAGRSVLVERGRQYDLRTRGAIALFVAGGSALLTTHTAALLHGCASADISETHVLVPYQRTVRRSPGVVFHQGLFEEQDVVMVDGLRVHVLECALADLLCRARRRTALACFDQALAFTEQADREALRAEVGFRIQSRRDPRGRRRGEILLLLGTGKAESPAESWLLLGFFDAGLPIPAQQHVVLDLDGRERYRLDFAWEEVRVAVEYDGYEAHVDRVVADEVRQADLERRGWTVLRADASDLRDPARLHAAIHTALHRRRFAA